jgi:hypothetical protein
VFLSAASSTGAGAASASGAEVVCAVADASSGEAGAASGAPGFASGAAVVCAITGRAGLRSGSGIGSDFAAATPGATHVNATRTGKVCARKRFISSIGTGYDLRLSGQDVPRPGSRDDKGHDSVPKLNTV